MSHFFGYHPIFFQFFGGFGGRFQRLGSGMNSPGSFRRPRVLLPTVPARRCRLPPHPAGGVHGVPRAADAAGCAPAVRGRAAQNPGQGGQTPPPTFYGLRLTFGVLQVQICSPLTHCKEMGLLSFSFVVNVLGKKCHETRFSVWTLKDL